MLKSNQIYLGDCLSVMQEIDDKSVDLIFCDLPFEKLWEQYHRIIKPNRVIVLHGSQPFTSLLIASNMSIFYRL